MQKLNYEVYYKTQIGELLRAAFATRYEAEKYVEEWHKNDKPRWYIKVLNDPTLCKIEYLD